MGYNTCLNMILGDMKDLVAFMYGDSLMPMVDLKLLSRHKN